tara:strand:+ start:14166 stop:14630 length:465 start_codon:yes stop_codon:yes gene_type:complete
MIQAFREAEVTVTQFIYMALYDTYGLRPSEEGFFRPLLEIVSQQTGKSKIFIPNALDTTYKERYFKMTYGVAHIAEFNIPVAGLIYLGTEDYPYGLYDLTAYRNTSAINLDPSTLTTVSKGLFHLRQGTNNEAVKYTEYESTQEQKVYITNEYI